MAKEIVEQLIDGGKASAGPPLGPMLGPLGLNINEVIKAINDATKEFVGMKVPVKIIVDSDTKSYTIEVGTPPTSALIKKEAGIEKGASNPKTEKVADLAIEQVIKIAKMKSDAFLGKDNIAKVKEVLGTCQSLGVLVEGKNAREIIEEINRGKYRDKILASKTELTEEELKKLEEEREKLKKEIEARKAEFEAKAKKIIDEMQGKTREQIIEKLEKEGIPKQIYESLLPVDVASQQKEKAVKEDKK